MLVLFYNIIMTVLKRKFFARDTTLVARDLLGKILCRREGGTVFKGKIVEVEVYTQDDPACHAYRGFSERTKSLFEQPGTAYVYFTYGMHYCINIVTDKKGYASGVLIRALEPVQNINNTNGPAKLTKAMNITRLHDGIDVTTGKNEIWIEDAEAVDNDCIIQTVRIGISRAIDYKRRFYIKDNKWVSKK